MMPKTAWGTAIDVVDTNGVAPVDAGACEVDGIDGFDETGDADRADDATAPGAGACEEACAPLPSVCAQTWVAMRQASASSVLPQRPDSERFTLARTFCLTTCPLGLARRDGSRGRPVRHIGSVLWAIGN